MKNHVYKICIKQHCLVFMNDFALRAWLSEYFKKVYKKNSKRYYRILEL